MDCKPKLLYAEDNRLTAKEMTEILEEEGYEVVTTYSGDEAWETFERISPDLVLLDFRMPGLNGLEVFERIRQVDAEIPVLILSSYNEYCVPSLKSGTADFIRKEADIEEICARIAAVWQRHASGKTNDSAGETVLRLSELTTFRTDSFTLRIGPNIIPLTGALGEVLVLLCRPPSAMPCSHRYLPATLAQRQQKQNHFTTKLYLSIAETAHCRPCPAHRQPLQ